ncbi:MAG: sulfite exporter TauE/SafE family protein [Anaerolineales bacterium]|nr:sulfite exporter TauE/SafE family protein [Anaerolineales bacterium]
MLLAPFLIGFLGSFGHCVGMCGGIVILLDRQTLFQNKLSWILVHAGRITTYSLLGAIFGVFGQTLWSFHNLQAIISILFALIAFYMAAAFIGLTPSPELLLSGWSGRWGKLMRGYKSASPLSPYLIGLLWGLLPCGLILAALVTAIAAKSAWLGALNMFVFGIATVPSLFLVKWLAGKSLSRLWSRGLASLTLMVFGFQFAMRGFAALGLVNHFMLGEFMFW